MAEIIEAPAPEVIAQPSPAPDAPKRFEIPSFTDKKVDVAAADAPDAPKADLPPATEKPPEAPDPAAESRKEKLRVNRLYRQIAEERVRRETAERQLAEARPKPAAPSGEPRTEDFTDLAEYAKAIRAHERELTTRDFTAQQEARTNEAQQKQLTDGWEKQSELGAGKYEDFEQIVGELKPTTPWAIAVMQADNAADVAYYLGTHLDDTKRIIALNPVSQIREIGKIEAKLLAAVPEPKKASKAPAPISPVSESARGSVAIEPGMDFEKFRKIRNRQLGRS